MKLKSTNWHFRKQNFYEVRSYSGTYSFKRLEKRRIFAVDSNGVYKEYVLGKIEVPFSITESSTYSYKWQYSGSRLTIRAYFTGLSSDTYRVTLCSFWARVWNDEQQTSYTIYNESNWKVGSSSIVETFSQGSPREILVFDAPGTIDDIRITLKIEALDDPRVFTYYNYPKTKGNSYT